MGLGGADWLRLGVGRLPGARTCSPRRRTRDAHTRTRIRCGTRARARPGAHEEPSANATPALAHVVPPRPLPQPLTRHRAPHAARHPRRHRAGGVQLRLQGGGDGGRGGAPTGGGGGGVGGRQRDRRGRGEPPFSGDWGGVLGGLCCNPSPCNRGGPVLLARRKLRMRAHTHAWRFVLWSALSRVPCRDGPQPAAAALRRPAPKQAAAPPTRPSQVWARMMPPAMLLSITATLPVPESWVPGHADFTGGVAELDRVGGGARAHRRARLGGKAPKSRPSRGGGWAPWGLAGRVRPCFMHACPCPPACLPPPRWRPT